MTRILTVLIVFVLIARTAQGQVHTTVGKSDSSAQVLFYPDDENRGFLDAAPPSDAVLDALLLSSEVKNTVEEMNEDKMDVSRAALRKLFEVVPVHLTTTSKNSYVVLGNSPMSGGDCNWFWIVSGSPESAKVILYSAGLSLQLRQTRTKGFRDLRETWGTAAFHGYRFYHFDGVRYRPGKDYVQSVKP